MGGALICRPESPPILTFQSEGENIQDYFLLAPDLQEAQLSLGQRPWLPHLDFLLAQMVVWGALQAPDAHGNNGQVLY